MDFFVWQRTVVDEAGNVLPSASVSVTDVVSGALAQLYSDEGITGIGNPIAADSNGFVQFFVKSGIYDIVATLGLNSRTWNDEAIGAPYRITADEISAAVTLATYQYPPGDVRRYGADEGEDISGPLQDAIDANDVVTIPLAAVEAAGINLRTGVHISGLGRDRTVITRTGTDSIFQNAGATTECGLSDMTLDADSSFTNPVCDFVAGTNSFRASRIRFINFDNASSACACFEWATSNATQSNDIRLDDIEFDNSNASTSNYNTVLIYNGRGVKIVNCLFTNSGNLAFATGGSYAATTGDIVVRGNTFRGVDSSVILIRASSACLLENVQVTDNDFYDCSPTLGKYCITVQQSPTTTGASIRNVSIAGNNGRLTDVDCDGFIVISTIGAAAVNGITIIGNNVDFTDSSGAVHTSGNTDQRGIWVFGDTTNLATNVTIVGNSVRGSQSFGIGINSALGWTIAGNTLDLCVTNTASGGVAIESGIYIPQGTTRQGTIVGNTVVNSGGGGAGQSGMGSASISTVSHIVCSGNTCIDNRAGSAAMVYGYNFGSAATNIWWGQNQSIGHTTASVNPASPGVVAYTGTNRTLDRAMDANAAAVAETNDVLLTFIEDVANGRFITGTFS